MAQLKEDIAAAQFELDAETLEEISEDSAALSESGGLSCDITLTLPSPARGEEILNPVRPEPT